MPISSSNVRLTNMTDFEIRAKNVTTKWSQINRELQNRRESVVEKVLLRALLVGIVISDFEV